MAKIMVVDDDPDVVEACELVLKKAGHEISSAGSRKEGMEKAKAEKPDLLILDVMMEEPDDGIRMARQIRREGFHLPILMLTSVNAAMGLHIDKDDEVVPVDEFQEKPVDPPTLIRKVEQLLAGRKES